MFGIQNTLLKLAVLIITGIVIICAITVAGCVPLKASLATKEITENHDNSIDMPDGITAYDPVEAIKAKAEERVALVRAEQEKWRLLVWVVGSGGVIVAIFALFIRSPLDRKNKGIINE